MTKSTITRERLQELAAGQSGFNLRTATHEESQELARMALAAMDSEPHTDDELSNLLWYSQEATCHSDQNYYCEFQRLATPGLIAGIIRDLQERRKADSEPVGAAEPISFDEWSRKCALQITLCYPDFREKAQYIWDSARETQHVAPVVPDEVTAEDCPALVNYDVTEVDKAWARGFNACRAAMLSGGKP